MASKLNSINKNVDSTQRTYQVFTPNLDKFSDKYKGLAEANPYANPTYKRSWWQSLLSNLGFRTNYDAYLEGMNLQAQEYENSLLQKQYDEEFNSPIEQANRERLAGLNPNLTGNVSAGEAVPLPDDGNPPVPPQADDVNQIYNFASSVVQGVQMGFSLASGITDLKGRIIDNRAKNIEQIGLEDKLAFDALLNILPANSDEPLNYHQLYSQFRKAYSGHIKKRYFPAFVNRAMAFQNGLAFEDVKYSKENNRAGNRKEFYIKTSGQDYSEENMAMRQISGVLSDLNLEVYKIIHNATIKSNEASIKKSENDLKFEEENRPVQMANDLAYNKALDPEKLAKNEMDTSDLQVGILHNQKIASDLEKAKNDSIREIFAKLQKLEDDGNWFAPYLRFGISAWLLGSLPSLPVSINTGARHYHFAGSE